MGSSLPQHVGSHEHKSLKRFKNPSAKKKSEAYRNTKNQNQLRLRKIGRRFKKCQSDKKIVKKRFTKRQRLARTSRITITVGSDRTLTVSWKRLLLDSKPTFLCIQTSYTKIVKCPKCSRILSLLQPVGMHVISESD